MADLVLERIRSLNWSFADADSDARLTMERRLAEAARQGKFVAYSELVRGIAFTLSNVKGPPLQLGVPDWIDLHRAIIGDFLGRISCDSCEKAGFLASAVAVSSTTQELSEGFRSLVNALGLAPRRGDDFPCSGSSRSEKLRPGTRRIQARGERARAEPPARLRSTPGCAG